MNLFEHVPDNFFGILTFSNKSINLRALMTLYEAFQLEWRISKSDLVVMLMSDLDGMLDGYEPDEEDEEDNGTMSSHAHSLIRKLARHGWIDIEYGSDSFEEMVTIPDYSFRFIRVIYEISSNTRDAEYNRYVYGTYSVLKTSTESGQEFTTAVNAAYSQTYELTQKLRLLLNNIKRYHKQLADSSDMNLILYEHFDDFKATLADKIYYPIKTFDSVHRYKMPILTYVKDWLSEESIIEQMMEEVWSIERQKGSKNEIEVKQAARTEAISKMVKIVDIYNGIDDLLGIIDKKNSDYTKATFERIDFLINTDRSVKGKVKELIKVLGSDPSDKWYDRIEGSLSINRQEALDEQSLYKPRKRKARRDVRREGVREMTDAQSAIDGAEDFKQFVQHTYSQKKIYQHVLNLLNEKERIHVSEIDIEDDHDYISTVLGVLNGEDKKSGYNVEYGDEKMTKNRYTVPEFEFVRRSKK